MAFTFGFGTGIGVLQKARRRWKRDMERIWCEEELVLHKRLGEVATPVNERPAMESADTFLFSKHSKLYGRVPYRILHIASGVN